MKFYFEKHQVTLQESLDTLGCKNQFLFQLNDRHVSVSYFQKCFKQYLEAE